MKVSCALITGLAFLSTVAMAGTITAKTVCKVTAVKGSTVTLDCGDKAEDFATGMKVQVKAKKKAKAIEGC